MIPPLCLLLAGLWTRRGESARWLPVTIAVALLASGGYAGWLVFDAFRADARGLVRLGAQARTLAGAHPERLAVVKAKDEGVILYAGRLRSFSLDEAGDLWRAGEIDWLLLDDRDLESSTQHFQPYRIESSVPLLRDKKRPYYLIHRLSSE